MTLGKKIALNFVVLVLAAVVMGVYTARRFDRALDLARQRERSWGELQLVFRLDEALEEYQAAVIMAGLRLRDSDQEALQGAADRLRANLRILTDFHEGQVEVGDDEAVMLGGDLDHLANLRDQIFTAAQRALEATDESAQTVRMRHFLELCSTMDSAMSASIAADLESMEGSIEEFAPIERELDTALLIWGLGFLALIGVFWLVLAGFLLRPIHALRAGVAALSGKDFAHRMPVTTRDEFGAVAEQFNTMAEELETFYHRLEDQVAEKTDEIRRTYDELQRSQKLAAVGTLAAGVAHEINNPLEAITVTADGFARALAQGEMPSSDEMRETVEAICEDVARCRSITDQLLAFSRQRPAQAAPVIEVVDLAPLLRGASDLAPLSRGADERRITCDVEGDGLWVRGDPSQLRQVFLNLMLNAVEATQPGGEIWVTARADGDEIQVAVTDDGMGIDRCDLPHLFEPFYSTKTAGKNTGLGLAVVHGIVADHGGWIEAESQGLGRGATFLARFPRVDQTP